MSVVVLSPEELQELVRSAVREVLSERPLPSKTAEPRLLSINDACKVLKCGRTTIYQLRRRGDLHAVNIGRAVRFRAEDVQRLTTTPST